MSSASSAANYGIWPSRSRSDSVTHLVQDSITRDLEETPAAAEDDDSEQQYSQLPRHSLAGSYRRPSFSLAGSRLAFAPLPDTQVQPSAHEYREILQQERSLLCDNEIIPQKHPQSGKRRGSLLFRPFKIPNYSRGLGDGDHDEGAVMTQEDDNSHGISQNTPLLRDTVQNGGQGTAETTSKKWEEAVIAGTIQTSWQREVKVLGGYCGPLMITFLLQYSPWHQSLPWAE